MILLDDVLDRAIKGSNAGVMILVADNGNGRWYCPTCGATSMGNVLQMGDPRGQIDELMRLAKNHAKRLKHA